MCSTSPICVHGAPDNFTRILGTPLFTEHTPVHLNFESLTVFFFFFDCFGYHFSSSRRVIHFQASSSLLLQVTTQGSTRVLEYLV